MASTMNGSAAGRLTIGYGRHVPPPMFGNVRINHSPPAYPEGDLSGEHWKTEEGIQIDPDTGTCPSIERANAAFADASRAVYLAQTRYAAAYYACSALGAGVYALRPPLPNEGLKVGEIEAWRAWLMRKDGELVSVSAEYVWKRDQVNTAEDNSPTEENGRGFWCFKRREDVAEQFNDRLYAIGRIKIWGKIVEHELGYRGEFAKIEEIVSEPHARFDSADELRTWRPAPTLYASAGAIIASTTDPVDEGAWLWIGPLTIGAVVSFAVIFGIALHAL